MSADAIVIRCPTGIGKTATAWFLHELLREAEVPSQMRQAIQLLTRGDATNATILRPCS